MTAAPTKPSSLGSAEDTERAAEMLRWWFHGCTGVVAAAHDAGEKWPSNFADVDHLDTLAPKVAGYGAQLFPTYVRVSTMLARPQRAGARGGNADTHELPGLYADIDGDHGTHATRERLPESLDVVRELLAGLPEPSVIVDTGGGWHFYWKCTHPIPAELAVDAQKRWAAMLKERFNAAGYHVDKLDDPARVMRWPGTYNTKAGDQRPVSVIESTGQLHELDRLLDHAPSIEAPAPASTTVSAPVNADVGDPLEALRAMGHAGHQFVARAATDVGWQVTADTGSYVDVLRPGGSSERSARLGGTHPTSGGDMTGQVHVFSHAVPGVDGDSDHTVGGFLAAVRFDGDINACREWLALHGIGLSWEQRRLFGPKDVQAMADYIERNRADAPDGNGARLPDSFWQERPAFAHMRAAAHSRGRSAELVLFSALARLSAYVSHTLELPATVGSTAPLNLYVAAIGKPGAGKSSGAGIADELLERPDDIIDRPLGSGEGIAENYIESVTEKDDDGKRRTVRRQVRHNVFIICDEGEQLIEQGMGRAGATLPETLRRAWSGQDLGQSNATSERTRHVRAGQYVLGMLVGFQPSVAGQLLDDGGAGTPQRFLFASADDPTIPDERTPWPGELKVPKLSPHELTTHRITRKGFVRHQLGVDPQIADQLWQENLARVRGQQELAELDAHQPLHLLKLSGLLAVLDGRLDITLDDWRLAGTLWRRSCVVRDQLLADVRRRRDSEEATRLERHALREQAGELGRSSAGDAVQRLAKRIAGWAHEQTAAGDAPADGFPKRDLHGRLASRERHLYDAALAHAVAQGWLIELEDGARHRAGDSAPAQVTS